ncbi:uncharacterized protein Nmag_3884 (plasmid) [Natrialba magadii ATCC 43099]|nr:uncharacterized protein Nmag_3884 [Natrialba magadii ATCC 43099]
MIRFWTAYQICIAIEYLEFDYFGILIGYANWSGSLNARSMRLG